MQTVLVTGGAGYIGSHTVVKLLQDGYKVIVLDNFCNSKREVIKRIQRITGKHFGVEVGDVRDRKFLRSVFANNEVDVVIHFAGLKAVGDSALQPALYYDCNVCGSIVLFDEMQYAGVKSLVFSSSATVYGNPRTVRYEENLAVNPVNVYGRTKRVVEDVLADIKQADASWKIISLRYFNPVGAHESGLIGEDPVGIPNNLMPYITQVAIGKLDKIKIFGNDYPTPDGTGMRDYIHVEDLADGHLAAIKLQERSDKLWTLNLGTGRAYSVFELIAAFEKVAGVNIPYTIEGRRFGDLAEYFADATLAKTVMNWSSKLDIERMCADAWRWQLKNPVGYSTTNV